MRKLARSGVTLVALFVFSTQAATNDTNLDNYVGRAKQFFRKFYAGLDDNLIPLIQDNNRLSGTTDINMFTMQLYENKIPRAGVRRVGEVDQEVIVKTRSEPEGCWCSTSVLLGADFGFDWRTASKDLFMAWVFGPFVDDRRRRFAAEVDQHPDWSDAQVLSALRDAGARFGPDHKAEFLQILPIGALRPFTGDLEVVSVEFRARKPAVEGTPSQADLTWIVRAKWHSSDGRLEANAFLTFEPFEGRLLQFHRDIVPHPIVDR